MLSQNEEKIQSALISFSFAWLEKYANLITRAKIFKSRREHRMWNRANQTAISGFWKMEQK